MENYYKRRDTHVTDLFQEICAKLDQQSREYLQKVIPIGEDKHILNSTDTIIILNYVKQIVIYLIKTKLELEERVSSADQQSSYENLIQKLEADVRQHIRIEQQLRLYTETLQQKIDEFMVERNQQAELLKEYEQQIKQKNKDIIVYQSELRKVVNKNQQMKTEPVEQFRKSSQTLASIRNSPERLPPRKISMNYVEVKTVKQPVFIKCLNGYRSTSQDKLK